MSKYLPNEPIKIAYVIRDNIDGHYNRDILSPVRLTHPYGSEIRVLQIDGEWAIIEAFKKKAWVPADGIDTFPPPQRQKWHVNIVYPRDNSSARPFGPTDPIEYGPRGGRFTRTKTGHRRYF